MDNKYNWLNDQIERLQAGRGIASAPHTDAYQPDDEDVLMLQMAALLNSGRPGATDPEPGFLERLRGQVIAVLDEPRLSMPNTSSI